MKSVMRHLLDDAELAVLPMALRQESPRRNARLRQEGLKVGLIGPITLWPFPSKIIQETSKTIHDFFVFEIVQVS